MFESLCTQLLNLQGKEENIWSLSFFANWIFFCAIETFLWQFSASLEKLCWSTHGPRKVSRHQALASNRKWNTPRSDKHHQVGTGQRMDTTTREIHVKSERLHDALEGMSQPLDLQRHTRFGFGQHDSISAAQKPVCTFAFWRPNASKWPHCP